MRNHKDDHGVSALVGFIIAIVLFSVSFYYVVESSLDREANTGPAEAANFHQLAASVASQIFEKGTGWYAGSPCIAIPVLSAEQVGALDGSGEPLGRFGLGDEGCEYNPSNPRRNNNLSYAKFSNINSAAYAASSTNGYVDYVEAHRSLGLDDRDLDFHIRSEPVLASVRQILGTGYKDPYLRPLYLGNYVDGELSTIVRPTVTTVGSFTIDSPDSEFGTVSVTITNTGTVTSGFSVDFSILLEKKPITFTVNSFPIDGNCDPDCFQVVSATIRKSDDWDWPPVSAQNPDPKKFTYAVSDSIGPVRASYPSGQLAAGSHPMVGDMSEPTDDDNAITTLNMDRRNYALPFSGSNKWPKASYAAYDGDGDAINNFDGADVDLKIIKNPGGANTPVATLTNPDPSQSLEDYLDANNDDTLDFGVGRYSVELWVPNTAGMKQSTAYFEITATATECNIQQGDFVPAQSAITEADYVDRLFEQFQEGAHDPDFAGPDIDSLPYVLGGDVFPDVKCAMNNDLPRYLEDAAGNPTLAQYTTLIVGSDVDHNVMTSEAAKGTIRDWVFAGGTLIVFGSSDQSVQWLQPIFHAALDSGSTSLYTPDPDHPALNVPNELDYNTFISNTQWSYNAGSGSYFSHVVSNTENNDILGISNGGSFGAGKVLLSGWRPYALQQPAQQAQSCGNPLTAQCQGLALMHNLVVLSYRNLYLDYGPSIPLDAANGVQTRIASVYHPDLKQLVTVYIQVYVFQ